MKKDLAIKKLDKLVKKNTVVYKTLHGIIFDGDSPIVRPCTYVRSAYRGMKIIDRNYDFINVLSQLKIKYEVGNDAPRGGKGGDWIKILTKFTN